MNKIDIAKKAVRLVTGYGTSIIVNSVIQNNVRTERIDQQIAVAAASVAIGGAVSEVAGSQTDKLIDDLVGAVTSFKKN